MRTESFLQKLKNKLFKGFAIYLGTSIVNKAIPFLLLPILTKYLSTEEYGILAIYQVVISFADTIIGMRTKSNISRNFFKYDKEYVGQVVFNMVFILWVSSTFFLVLISIYIGLDGELFSLPERWLYALPVIAFMNMVNGFNLAILRNRKRALEYGGFEITRTFTDLSISILLIVIYSYGWEGRAYGILIGASLVGLFSFYRIWQSGYLVTKVDFKISKEILLVSMPLIIHGLGTTVITLSDRIFINEMVSTSAVGIYTVGYQFGMMMFLVVTAFNLTWSPWMYELLAEEKKESKFTIVKATYLVSGGFIALALIVTGISYYLLPFMTAEEYHSGFIYVIWIALGYAFNGMYSLVQPYGIHIGKTSYLGITTSIAAIINIIANYILIGQNGPIGAAQATLISYIIMFISVWWYSYKLYPMPWLKFNK
ncbi:MAG: oligosaccharide flippase family protein [Balneolaceae bacterium]